MRSPIFTGRMVGMLIIIIMAAFTIAIIFNKPAGFSLLQGQIELLINYSNHFIADILLGLIFSFIIAWISCLLFPLIKDQSRVIALCFICSISIVCISIILGALVYMYIYLLTQNIIDVPNQNLGSLRSTTNLAREIILYTSTISTATGMVSGLFLCYSMFKSRIIPRFLSVWGFIGNALVSILLLIGLLITIGTVGNLRYLLVLLCIPAGLWYFIAFPFWLLINGFNPPTNKSCRGGLSSLSTKEQDLTNTMHYKTLEDDQARSLRLSGKKVGALDLISSLVLGFAIVFDKPAYYASPKNTMDLLTEHSGHLLVGFSLLLIVVFMTVWIIFLLYPIVKEQSRTTSLFLIYLTISECISLLFISFVDLYVYSQAQGAIDASNQSLDSLRSVVDLALKMRQYTYYYIAPATSVVCSLLLCYSMFKSRIVPRPLSVWGFVGCACILLGELLDISGVMGATSGAMFLLNAPGMLWALIAFPLWLLNKGFNPPVNQSYS